MLHCFPVGDQSQSFLWTSDCLIEFYTWVFLQQKFKRDPYVTTLGGFSKVTNYIFDALRGTEEQHQRPPDEVADLLGEIIPGLEINQQEEPGFEVITRVSLSFSLLSEQTNFKESFHV